MIGIVARIDYPMAPDHLMLDHLQTLSTPRRIEETCPHRSTMKLARGSVMAILLSCMLLVPGCTGDDIGENGDPLPEFSLTGDDGKTYSKEALDGEKFLIHFTASWCPRCYKTMHNSTDAIEGLTYLVVSTDAEDQDVVQSWHRQANESNETQNLDIPFMVGSELAEGLGIDAMPTLYLISAMGNIIDIHEGDLTKHDEIRAFWEQEL